MTGQRGQGLDDVLELSSCVMPFLWSVSAVVRMMKYMMRFEKKAPTAAGRGALATYFFQLDLLR